jgi:uncharacterized protein
MTADVVAEATTHKALRTIPESASAAANSAARSALLVLIRVYMILLSPFFGGACKFEPSCSNYAYEAIARHGAGRGLVLAMKRLLRCRPFTVGGYDPVPECDAAVREITDSSRERGLAQ